MIIKKGQHLTFASGEYDDYGVDSLVIVKADFNVKTGAKQWAKLDTDEEFHEWLIKKGIVQQLDYIEIHTGSYGDPEITIGHENLTD